MIQYIFFILLFSPSSLFVNVVKYKLDHMRRKIEMDERDNTSRSSFICTSCKKTYTDYEVGQLLDPMTGELICTICGLTVRIFYCCFWTYIPSTIYASVIKNILRLFFFFRPSTFSHFNPSPKSLFNIFIQGFCHSQKLNYFLFVSNFPFKAFMIFLVFFNLSILFILILNKGWRGWEFNTKRRCSNVTSQI